MTKNQSSIHHHIHKKMQMSTSCIQKKITLYDPINHSDTNCWENRVFTAENGPGIKKKKLLR